MASVMAGLFTLMSVLALSYLFHQVARMMADHNYRMKILSNNHERDMTMLRSDHQQELAKIEASKQPQISVPPMQLTVEFVRYSEFPDQKEIGR